MLLLQCVIYVCEVLEKMRGLMPDQLFEFISGQQPVLEAILMGAMLDESLLKRLEGTRAYFYLEKAH